MERESSTPLFPLPYLNIKQTYNINFNFYSMEENKRFIESEFVKDFLKNYEEINGKDKAEKLAERNVGNNGYSLNQTFTLTGDIKTVKNKINGVNAVYIALTTKEGTDLSLQALMGVSSLKGYVFGEDVEVEFTTGKDNEGNPVKKTRKVKSDFSAAKFDSVWTPKTRNLLELAGRIAEKDVDLTNKEVQYLGTAVKPFVAKKKGEQNGEKYEQGYVRVIETKLWHME